MTEKLRLRYLKFKAFKIMETSGIFWKSEIVEISKIFEIYKKHEITAKV